MGTRLINQPLLLNIAAPLDARSHFITLTEASKTINLQPDPVDETKTICVVASTLDQAFSAGTYVNYYPGQIITTEKDGTFVVCENSGTNWLKQWFIEELTNVTTVTLKSKTNIVVALGDTAFTKTMTWSVSGATTINAISYVIFSDFSVKTANIVVSIDGGFKWEVTFSEDPTFYLKPLEIEGGGSASYTLPVASTFELGGIQLASDETQESGVAALPVFLNTDHQAYADMPIITESYLDQTLVSRLHFISKVDETTFEIDNETLYLHTVNGGSVNNG